MTLVVDASAVAELLLGTERGARVAAALADHGLIAPQHLTAEVACVVRGWLLGGHITAERARLALSDFADLRIDELPMVRQLPGVLELRHNLSAYDAFYVVLARTAECALLTLDARLARAAPDCARVP